MLSVTMSKGMVTLLGTAAVSVVSVLVLTVTGVFDKDAGSTDVAGKAVESPAADEQGSIDWYQPRESATVRDAARQPAGAATSAGTQSMTSDEADVAGGAQPASPARADGPMSPAAQQPDGGSTQQPDSASTQQPGGGSKKPGGGAEPGTFEISGSVAGLYPGGTRPLALKLENTSSQSMKVTDLSVAAAASNRVGCDASNIIEPSYRDAAGSSDDIVVTAHGEKTVTLQMRMVADPAEACKSATWVLTYSGRAVKA